MLLSRAALLQYFTELDAADAAKAKPVAPLPVKVSGISGDLVADLYRTRTSADNFAAIIGDLIGLTETLDSAPVLISRFFKHNNYSPEECDLVVKLLTTDAFKTYESVSNQDLREIIIGA